MLATENEGCGAKAGMIDCTGFGRVGRPSRIVRAIALATALSASGAPVLAQSPPGGEGQRLPFIRDAEIEQLLRDYTTPILRAAGLGQQNVQVVIINDRSFNAFVADGHRIFVNAGALTEATTPNQIIGVLAHETGHLAGGHLSKIHQELAKAQTASLVAMLLGLGAVAASAASHSAGTGDIGAAALMAPQEVIKRSLLAYVRAQEEQADRAGVKFLNATAQSPKGMYDTFKRFAEQILYMSRYIDPYLQTHPMPAERVAALAEVARTSPYWDKKDPPELQLRHDLMRAKLFGFLDRPDALLHRYPLSDVSLPARYARAISAYRFSDLRGAIAQIDVLIAMQPQNPYFYELKGQALLEGGRPAEALAPLRKAISLAPNPTLMRVMLGQALVATNDPKLADEAVVLLRTALIRDPDVPDGYRYLAMAFGRKGDLADADLASAQSAFTGGDFKAAKMLAIRAKGRFPVGSPGWVKADDIETFKAPKPPGGLW